MEMKPAKFSKPNLTQTAASSAEYTQAIDGDVSLYCVLARGEHKCEYG
jgi:hypothetical protein